MGGTQEALGRGRGVVERATHPKQWPPTVHLLLVSFVALVLCPSTTVAPVRGAARYRPRSDDVFH